MAWTIERSGIAVRSLALSLLALSLLACGRSSGGATEAMQPAAETEGSNGGAQPSGPSGSASSGSSSSPEEFPPGTILDLQPTADCVHPEVQAECGEGMCRIPPGCFIMGAPRDSWAAGRYSDIQVQVTLTRPFEIGQHEVTYESWQVEGFEPPLRHVDEGDCREPACPVSNVNLFEILTFVNEYSVRRGLEPCYELAGCSGTFGSGRICKEESEVEPGLLVCEREEEDGLVCEELRSTASSVYECEGYRLPTEAEWEYATRAGTRTEFWAGPITAHELGSECYGDEVLEEIGWYCQNSGGRKHAVGEKRANPWGLFDTSGNVTEQLVETYSGLGYGDGPLVDPMGYWLIGRSDRNLMPGRDDDQPPHETTIVSRGGAYYGWSSLASSSRRLETSRTYASSGSGFRIARTLEH